MDESQEIDGGSWQKLIDFIPEAGRQYHLQEIADIAGVSRERVRQVELIALSKMERLARWHGLSWDDL